MGKTSQACNGNKLEGINDVAARFPVQRTHPKCDKVGGVAMLLRDGPELDLQKQDKQLSEYIENVVIQRGSGTIQFQNTCLGGLQIRLGDPILSGRVSCSFGGSFLNSVIEMNMSR